MLYKKRGAAAVICALICIGLLASCSAGIAPQPQRSGRETTSNTVRVTFPEGSTVKQIATLLEENSVCSAADFMAEADNDAYLADIPGEISNAGDRPFLLEGYIFPDTYDFYKNEGAESAISRFLENTSAKLTDEHIARAAELGYSVDEILTIASIIQEEAGDPAEMGKVSSVLHNRLSSPSFPKLQFDVATFYMRDSVKPFISQEDYDRYLPLYNTYECRGLPAGPITNPGMDAILAALYPETTNFYYFVTDADMNYYYAETYAEHLKNRKICGI